MRISDLLEKQLNYIHAFGDDLADWWPHLEMLRWALRVAGDVNLRLPYVDPDKCDDIDIEASVRRAIRPALRRLGIPAKAIPRSGS